MQIHHYFHLQQFTGMAKLGHTVRVRMLPCWCCFVIFARNTPIVLEASRVQILPPVLLAPGLCPPQIPPPPPTHLFAVLELLPEAFKHLRIHLLWGAGHSFYVELEDALQEMIHFCVVIIIVPAE